MMRIGIEVSALTRKSTGTGRFINCLLEQINLLPHEVKEFSPGNIAVQSANKIIPFKHNRHIYREFFIKKEMEFERSDCAFFPNYFLPENFKIPAAVVIHDLSFITHPHFYSSKFILYYKWKIKNTLSQNPIVTAVSENTKKNIISHLGVKKENIFLLQGYSNIVNREVIFNNKISSEPYLLYVGHIEPRKNLPFLIRNFIEWKETRKTDIKLKIAGELWINSKEINELLIKYDNHPDVEFMGYVSEEELTDLYREASGYVCAGFVEGFGFPVVEAMKYKLPILCSEGTACEEISSPYSVPVNPYNNQSLITGLDKLYQLINEKRRINYHEKYTPNLMQEQLNVIIDRLEGRMKDKKIYYLPKGTNIYEAVEKTLLYGNLHNSGLRRDLLHKGLFDVNASEEKVNEAVIKLYLDGRINIKDDVIYLNSAPENFYVKNEKKVNVKKTGFILKILSSVPFISGIAFSGGTAHYGLNKHDDVDLFIIAKKHTLYISYFIIHIVSLIMKARKEICANYLVDEDGLIINSNRDFYTAHQIISLKPYKNRSLLNLFFTENKWVQNYFPNFSIKTSGYIVSSKFLILAPVNYFFFVFYRILYRNKIKSNNTGVIISPNCLRLHTNDHRVKTLKAFEKAWKGYKSGNEKVIIKKEKNAAIKVLT